MNSSLINKLKNISEKEKQFLVQEIFSKVSKKYDLMNDVMSLGLHRAWKSYFVDLIEINNKSNVLDIASGSGDIIKLLKKRVNANFFSLDANKDMQVQAKKKISDKNVKFVNAFAEKLPFDKKYFDVVTVSFGMRNFSNINKSLSEVYKVLKDSGTFYCLEFSQINNKLLKNVYQLYSKIIPTYGAILANDSDSYKYLIKSIENFPNQVELSKKMKEAGFKQIEVLDIIDGLASIHIARK